MYTRLRVGAAFTTSNPREPDWPGREPETRDRTPTRAPDRTLQTTILEVNDGTQKTAGHRYLTSCFRTEILHVNHAAHE